MAGVKFLLLALVLTFQNQATFHQRGDLARTGNFAVRPLNKPAGAQWAIKPAFRDAAPAAISEGLVVIPNKTGSGYLMAVDAATGAQRWRVVIGQAAMTPAISNGVIYAGVMGPSNNKGLPTGRILALALKTGKEIWRIDSPRNESSAGLAVAGDRLYAQMKSGEIRAIEAATGKTLWSVRTAAEQEGSHTYPIVDGDTLYLSAGDMHGEGVKQLARGATITGLGSYLYALDVKTGAEKWRYKPTSSKFSGGALTGQPMLTGGLIYAPSHATIYVIDPATGKERRRIESPLRQSASQFGLRGDLVAADGLIFGSDGMEFLAWEMETGKLVWRWPTLEPEYGGRAAASGVFYFAAQDDSVPPKVAGRGLFLYGLDIKTLKILWKQPTSDFTGNYWGASWISPTEAGIYFDGEQLISKLH